MKRTYRGLWKSMLAESIAADIRYGFRSLTKSPVFLLTVVLTLGPGLGVNTALFSIFDSYFLRPLEVHDPNGLYQVVWQNRRDHQHQITLAEVESISRQKQIFSDVLAVREIRARVEGRPMLGQLVSGNYFGMLGVGVVQGRPFLPHQLRAETDVLDVVVLSHDAWKGRFGGDPAMIGRKIFLLGHPVEVVGIAAPGFTGLGNFIADFWAPLELAPIIYGSDQASGSPVFVTGRLQANVTYRRALSALEVWASQISEDQPSSEHVMLVSQATKLPLYLQYQKAVPFFVAFGLILLMACANVSNLMLARAIGRQREIGVRISLGATRTRLIRQLLTESLLLALPSAAFGLVLSAVALSIFQRAILATVPPAFAFFFQIPDWSLDFRVVTYVILASLGSTLTFGLIPSLQVTRASLISATGDFGNSGGGHPSRLRNVLVVGQVTVCVVLLICTAVLLRSRQTMADQSLGFDPQGVFVVQVPDRARANVGERVRQHLPTVQEAAAWRLPLFGRLRTIGVMPSEDNMTLLAGYNFVSPEYFTLLGVPIVAGRNFTASEALAEAPLVIVSEATARVFWPNRSPLGQPLRIAEIETHGQLDPTEKHPTYSAATVVGVATNIVSGLVGDGIDHTCIYFPTTLQSHNASLIVRATAGTLPLTADALEKVLPDAADDIVSLNDAASVNLFPFRLTSWVGGCLSCLGLILFATGIYGVLTYWVNQRSKEFGIRAALGATSGDLIFAVLRQSFRLVGLGTTVGLLLSAAIAPVFANRLEALNPFDVAAYVTAALLALGVSLVAAFFPTRRAARVDPALSLRSE